MFKRALTAIVAVLSITGCTMLPHANGFPVQRPERLVPGNGLIAVVGDLQMTPLQLRMLLHREKNVDQQAKLLADMAERLGDLAAIVILGDLVFTGGSNRDWRHFDSLMTPFAREVPLLPAVGNHDYHCFMIKFCRHGKIPGELASRFPWLAPGEPYFVSYGDIALVFLDTETRVDYQGEWLSRWLAEQSSDFSAVVVFTHRPPFTDGDSVDTYPDERVQQHVVSTLQQSDIPYLMMSGHVHGYEHLMVDNRHFVVSAGGGGSRSRLFAERPNDVYRGRVCDIDEDDRPLRPYNYALLDLGSDAIDVTIRGFCRTDASVEVLETFSIPLRRGGGPVR
jgi:Icc-related predicted phosphoesterase